MQTTGQQLVSFLEANGVDRVFCVPGESFLPLLDALGASKIDTITARHESSAGFMALADGRLSGRPGVFMVSRGPGATNASIAVHSAQQDGTPLILMIGQGERQHVGRDSFQEIDYSKMFGSIAKWVYEINDPTRVPEVMARAFSVAMSGTPGPVVISLPEDILPIELPDVKARASAVATSAPTPRAMQQVLELLAKAERPLLLAGGDFATDEQRAALRAAAEKHNIPVVIGFRRHGVFSSDHPLYAGDIGTGTSAAQVKAFEQADLLMAIGTRLSDWGTLNYRFPTPPWPNQTLVHACADVTMIGKNFQPEVGMVCHGAEFIRAFAQCNAVPEKKDRSAWISELHGYATTQAVWKNIQAPDGVAFGNVVRALGELTPDATSIVPDAGISAALAYKFFPFKGRRKLYSTMSGVMGYGVPGAVAIAMREPERTVVCLVGDGGFMMTGNELAVAVERKLPVKIFLSNNRSLGTIRLHQERMYPGRSHATDLTGPDFSKLAQAFGCETLLIEKDEDIEPMIRAALKATGPVFVEVKASLSAILPKT